MRIIKLNDNNVVVGLRDGTLLYENEIQSDTGVLGQIMQDDGTFIDPSTEPIERQPTLDDRLTSIENTLDILLLKQEGIL